MVSKRQRTVKRQRRQRQQRGGTVKRGGGGGEEEQQKLMANSFFKNDSSTIEQQFSYNNKTYKYKVNEGDGLVMIVYESTTDENKNETAFCYIKLYNGNPFRINIFRLSRTSNTNQIKDSKSIENAFNSPSDNIFVEAFNRQNDKLKIIEDNSGKKTSLGTLTDFLQFLAKNFNDDNYTYPQTIIQHGPIILDADADDKPQNVPQIDNAELTKLSEELTNALNCVRILYDDTRKIIIKKVVLSRGAKLGGKIRRSKISTRQIRNIIENSIKFGGVGGGFGSNDDFNLKNSPQYIIQKEIDSIIKNITLPNGLKIEKLEIGFEQVNTGGNSIRRRRQTRMKTRKQYKSRN